MYIVGCGLIETFPFVGDIHDIDYPFISLSH